MGDTTQQFISNIEQSYNDKTCPMCGGKEWGTLPIPLMMQVAEQKQGVPLAAKFCVSCGYMNAFLKISKG